MCLRFCSMPSQHLVISRMVSALDIRSLQHIYHLWVPCDAQEREDARVLFPHSDYIPSTHASWYDKLKSSTQVDGSRLSKHQNLHVSQSSTCTSLPQAGAAVYSSPQCPLSSLSPPKSEIWSSAMTALLGERASMTNCKGEDMHLSDFHHGVALK